MKNYKHLSPQAQALSRSPPLSVEDLDLNLEEILSREDHAGAIEKNGSLGTQNSFDSPSGNTRNLTIDIPAKDIKPTIGINQPTNGSSHGEAEQKRRVEIKSTKSTLKASIANHATISGAAGVSLQKELAGAKKARVSFIPAVGSVANKTWAHPTPDIKGIQARNENSGMHHVESEIRRRHLSVHEHKKEEKLLSLAQKFESFDYDFNDTPFLHQKHASNSGNVLLEKRHTELVRWFLAIVIGILLGVITFAMTQILSVTVHWKFHNIADYVQKDDYASAYWFTVTTTVVCVFIASSLTVLAPASAGSGIPVVKAFLNGNKIEGITRLETLIAKVFGVMACVLAGMPAGREGPMVHTGAIVSAGMARGESKLLPHGFQCFHYNTFDNPKDRRDFVSMGAAAGVAAAFNAPLGGILFSLEEVSSYWSGKHMWRVFVCATLCSFTVNVMMQFKMSTIATSKVEDEGMILFGTAGQFEAFTFSSFHWWEVPLFAALGMIGGVLGALFCFCNKHLTMLRKRMRRKLAIWMQCCPVLLIQGNHADFERKINQRVQYICVLEAMVVMFFVASVFFWVPSLDSISGPCRNTSEVADLDILSGQDEHGLHPIQHGCDNKTEYSDMATLFFNPQESVAKQLFSRSTAGYFTPRTLVVFFAVFFPMSCFCYGLFVPAGLFVPTLINGAALGRLVGESLHAHYMSSVDPGMYALVGAAALLGGVTRMTISLAVILAELTNDINFLLPIMITLAVAKLVGDKLETSIYDIHMGLMGVPYLEAEPEDSFAYRTAHDAMRKEVKSLSVNCTVWDVCSLLSKTSHNGFPVVRKDLSGLRRIFVGLVNRESLQAKLQSLAQKAMAAGVVPSDSVSSFGSINGGDCEGMEPQSPRGRLPTRWDEPPSPGRGAERHPSGSNLSAASPKSAHKHSASSLSSSTSAHKTKQIRKDILGILSSLGDSTLEQRFEITDVMDPSPFVVQESLPLVRVYRLFRTLGLRHLVVLQKNHDVAGMITRKDFFGISAPLREKYGQRASLRYIRDTALRRSQADLHIHSQRKNTISKYHSQEDELEGTPRKRAESF